MNTKITYCLLLSLLLYLNSKAQSIERFVIGSIETSASSANIKLDQNIGEASIQTFTSSSLTLTQGFLQTDNSIHTNISKNVHSISYNAFPNPVINNLTISINNEDVQSEYTIEVYDVLGKIILSKQVLFDLNNTTHLDCKYLARGAYFVKIIDTNSNTTFKIYKS